MKNILADIQTLEHKLATDFQTYKKEHPETHKTPSDPLFTGETSGGKDIHAETHEGWTPKDHAEAAKAHTALAIHHGKKWHDTTGVEKSHHAIKTDFHNDKALFHGHMSAGSKPKLKTEHNYGKFMDGIGLVKEHGGTMGHKEEQRHKDISHKMHGEEIKPKSVPAPKGNA